MTNDAFAGTMNTNSFCSNTYCCNGLFLCAAAHSQWQAEGKAPLRDFRFLGEVHGWQVQAVNTSCPVPSLFHTTCSFRLHPSADPWIFLER